MALSRSSFRWIRLLVVGSCLLPLLQACGGRSNTEDYLFGADGTIVQAGASSTAGQGTGGSGTGTSGASSTSGSGTVGGSGVTVGGTGTVGGSRTGGAGPIGGDVAVGGEGTAGTSVGGTGVGGSGTAGAAGMPGSTIACGAARCNAQTQQCCAGFGGFSCIGDGAQCNGASLGCTVKADCPGNEVCCISVTGDASAASSCKPRCETMGGGRDRQLCQADADCAEPFRFCTQTVFGVSICTRRP